jgi:cytosine deaminase
MDQMREMFRSVTQRGAEILHIDGYGLEKGCNADMVILQAADEVEALRLKANRLYVIRRGRVISQMPPATATLDLDGARHEVDFHLTRPD